MAFYKGKKQNLPKDVEGLDYSFISVDLKKDPWNFTRGLYEQNISYVANTLIS